MALEPRANASLPSVRTPALGWRLRRFRPDRTMEIDLHDGVWTEWLDGVVFKDLHLRHQFIHLVGGLGVGLGVRCRGSGEGGQV